MIDNDLCRTYVPFKFVTHADPAPAGQRLEEIDIEQPVATSGQRIGGVGAIINIQPWDDNKNDGFGRRTFSMKGGTQGHIDIVQGITKLTPVWTRVEGLQLGRLTSYVWDMRLATTSIPAEELAAIIAKKIDPKKFEDRIKVVRFYLQMERYDQAKAELDHVIRDFPGREGLNDVVHDLQQFRAEQRIARDRNPRQSRPVSFDFWRLAEFPRRRRGWRHAPKSPQEARRSYGAQTKIRRHRNAIDRAGGKNRRQRITRTGPHRP